jgi:hypothetical protein
MKFSQNRDFLREKRIRRREERVHLGRPRSTLFAVTVVLQTLPETRLRAALNRLVTPPHSLTLVLFGEELRHRLLRANHQEDVAVTRLRWLLAVAFGLGIISFTQGSAQAQDAPSPANSGLGAEPPRLSLANPEVLSPNQQVANAIADHLRRSGRLRHYRISITFLSGVAELTGQVSDEPQRQEALRLVQEVSGVEHVVDRLAIISAGGVTTAQAVIGPPLPEPGPLPKRADGTLPPEPTPIFAAAPGIPNPALQPPRMPPYAWPTYAPYNNYSRVACPTLYPYQAWPFIGPVYPFPKIPLGWRSVKLEWMDGHWWYGKNATGHDWWRIRYW